MELAFGPYKDVDRLVTVLKHKSGAIHKISKLNLVKSFALFSHNTLCFKEIMRDFLSSVMIELNCDSLKV